MKVAVYYGLNDVRIEDRPIPEIESDEILVEMKACGLCGSDLMDWYLQSRAPLVLGHEPSGVVVKVGDKVENFHKGERVFVHHHVACLTCYYCIHNDYTMCEQFTKTHIIPGGFAEYFKVPSPNLKIDTFKIPDEISFEEATLIEPVACCIRALRKCKIEPGDTVAIIGAGPSGIIHTILARHLGASQVFVSDLVDYRLKAAEDAGASVVVNPTREDFAKRVRAETDGRGADLVVVTAPSVGAYMEALRVCRKGGTVCVFAPTSPNDKIEVSPNRLFFNELKIVPSYSTSHVETRMALQLILQGVIDAKKLITHRFSLERIAEAFKAAKESKECLKIVILNMK
ncbi:MAG TPA: sorbitol dehydrogenase [Candidatus Bathyarchaeota archaeon]|nr:sorbitol dehydrogenase [Candidatus Bathyarchaeota archaeon]